MCVPLNRWPILKAEAFFVNRPVQCLSEKQGLYGFIRNEEFSATFQGRKIYPFEKYFV
jgi:hypothetical protein